MGLLESLEWVEWLVHIGQLTDFAGDWLCPKKKVNAQESPKLIQQYFVGWTIIWPDETHKLGSNTAIKGIVSIAIASEYAC